MRHILLVEDTQSLSEEIISILKLEGFEVDLAENALRGLELAAQKMPDLILTDLVMPGIDGFEFIRLIKSQVAFAAVPIIILTASISREDKRKGLHIGADALLEKPCKITELLTTINLLMSSN